MSRYPSLPNSASRNEGDMFRFGNILLVQLGDIGDVVLTTPTIRTVSEAYPEARISILVCRPFGGLLASDPSLHEVVEVAKVRGASPRALREHLRFARRLRHARYDLVIDLRTSERGAIYSFLTGAKVRICRHTSTPFWHDLLFTKLLPNPPYAQLPVHPGADQSLRIVRALGIDTKDYTPALHVAPHDRSHARNLLAERGLTADNRWVTINPCSRWKYKEWGYAQWGELIELLWQNHQITAVLVGSPEDAAAAEKIIAGCNDHAVNLTGKTTLGELSALLSMSTLHLGVDSAAPHIAAAVGTPTLTIFGPGNWKSWTVADELHRVITADMPCISCNRKGCDDTEQSRCLDELSTDRVYAEARAVLMALDRMRTTNIPANAG